MTATHTGSLKVLIAHHRWWFPTAVSGADLANHDFALKLAEKGVTVQVHGVLPPGQDRRVQRRRYNAGDIPVHLVKSDYLKQLRDEIRSMKPDVVLTTCPEPNSGADDITRMVETITRFDLPVVLYVHNLETTLPMFEKVKDQIAAVVTNSYFMARRIEELWFIPCQVVYPVPDWRQLDVDGSDGEFITFFNPMAHKGLGIVHALVTNHFPKRPFLFVEGFIDPEQHGIALHRSGNLVQARRSPDVATIYSMSRLVLIPSQWEEPFGRVALEAMACRVPVIASRTGGLPESVGNGGMLLDDFTDIDCWADAIRKLDDADERRQWIAAGKKHVRNFSLDHQVDKLIGILRSVTV